MKIWFVNLDSHFVWFLCLEYCANNFSFFITNHRNNRNKYIFTKYISILKHISNNTTDYLGSKFVCLYLFYGILNTWQCDCQHREGHRELPFFSSYRMLVSIFSNLNVYKHIHWLARMIKNVYIIVKKIKRITCISIWMWEARKILRTVAEAVTILFISYFLRVLRV